MREMQNCHHRSTTRWFLCVSRLLLTLLPAIPLFLVADAHGAIQRLSVPPRLQWNANFGYCGETSFISAGLAHGQYCSQYEARRLASPGVPQSQPDSQLLLGVNDRAAAAAMRLQTVSWNSSRQSKSRDFLQWTKAQVLAGNIPIIGVFTNEFLFYDDRNRNAGDPEYDHIVPVTGIQSAGPINRLSKTFWGSDQVIFSDNGLWDPSGTPPFIFSYRFDVFPRTRSAANAPNGPIYSINKTGSNYGIAVTGVADRNKETVPVSIQTNINFESPVMREGSNDQPAPSPLELTVTVSLPDQARAYVLYRYDAFEKVPEAQFNAHADQAVQSWQIPPQSGPKFMLNLTIASNESAIFRAVRATAR